MRTYLLSLAVVLSSVPSFAMGDDELRAALEGRFKADRTGACVAAAVIDKGKTARAYVCAKSQRPYDKHTAFEIGSCSKPMAAALLAELIARGEVALDDPIAKLLPPGTSVPSFNGRDITIRDIVTHTSGLPSFPWRPTDRNNPCAKLTERDPRRLGST
jgi:D-alanyl-D-alanine-carboxypeptidase/D-alanyl-D-alanine-endopeptidase